MPSWQASIGKDGKIQISRDGLSVRRASIKTSIPMLSLQLGVVIPDQVADLIEVAYAIHAVDRLIPRRYGRKNSSDQHRWNRQLRLQIPVRRPDLWMRSDVYDSLLNSLNYFAEDDWEFEFLPYGPQKSWSVQLSLFPEIKPARIVLFSGGLDSLVGLASHAQDAGGLLVPLAVGLGSRLRGRQRELLEQFKGRSRCAVLPLMLPFHLCQREPLRSDEERSQRTRGFLFGSLGASTALLTGAHEVFVSENGIGAINLPLTQAQLGAQSTRSTHPVGLRKLGDFLSRYLGCEMKFRLPYLAVTKGEACRILAATPFAHLIHKTISCDSFPLRLPGEEHCGICTSCLLRRQALFEAGLADNARYRYDLLRDPEHVPSRHWLPFKDMLWQVHRLNGALKSSDPWQGLIFEFPSLQEVAQEIGRNPLEFGKAQQQIVRLYRRYVEEWSHFPVSGLELASAA